MEIKQDIIIDEETYTKFCTKALVIKSLKTTKLKGAYYV